MQTRSLYTQKFFSDAPHSKLHDPMSMTFYSPPPPPLTKPPLNAGQRMVLAAGNMDPSPQELEPSPEPLQAQNLRQERAQPIELAVQQDAHVPISQRTHRARAVVSYFPSSFSQRQATVAAAPQVPEAPLISQRLTRKDRGQPAQRFIPNSNGTAPPATALARPLPRQRRISRAALAVARAKKTTRSRRSPRSLLPPGHLCRWRGFWSPIPNQQSRRI